MNSGYQKNNATRPSSVKPIRVVPRSLSLARYLLTLLPSFGGAGEGGIVPLRYSAVGHRNFNRIQAYCFQFSLSGFERGVVE